jgi:hypothetical protein
MKKAHTRSLFQNLRNRVDRKHKKERG